MTYKNGTTTHYMLAGDSGAGPDIFDGTSHYSTNRAWYVFPLGTVPVTAAEAKQGSVTIQAFNRRIVVSGTRDYRVYDIQDARSRPTANCYPASTWSRPRAK